ncbi:MAG: cobalamin biosynthesis protein [Rhodobacteraceae bacterium]|nr:cobalamin biosynthesis protein [Paracoccaceae bacterium]
MIVAGFGLRASASEDSLRAALAATGAMGLTAIAVPADKADHPALAALAASLKLPLLAVPLAQLVAERTPTQSARQPRRYGCGSVCEAAALSACGPGARLIRPRQISPCGTVTVAVATVSAQGFLP